MVQFYPTLWAGSIRTYMPVRPYLLSASSWGRFPRKDGTLRPARLPTSITKCAVDPGAFDAARRGRYQYDFEQYLRWLFTFRKGQIEWAGMPDYCCAFCRTQPLPEHIERSWYYETANGDPVRVQQIRTTFLAEMIWSCHRDVPWIWCPCIQGLSVNEYAWHAGDLERLILSMNWWYGPESAFRVGIGSLCRALVWEELFAIIEAVSDILPGVRFHLFGVKLKTFQTMKRAFPTCIVSTDSTEWHGLRKRVPVNVYSKMQTKEENNTEPEKRWQPIKVWKRSGESQIGYAYNYGLPAYEKAIDAALSQIRPTMLPLHTQHQSDLTQPDLNSVMYQEFRHIADEERRSLDTLPYPEGFSWHYEHPKANEWFWP